MKKITLLFFMSLLYVNAIDSNTTQVDQEDKKRFFVDFGLDMASTKAALVIANQVQTRIFNSRDIHYWQSHIGINLNDIRPFWLLPSTAYFVYSQLGFTTSENIIHGVGIGLEWNFMHTSSYKIDGYFTPLFYEKSFSIYNATDTLQGKSTDLIGQIDTFGMKYTIDFYHFRVSILSCIMVYTWENYLQEGINAYTGSLSTQLILGYWF